MSDNVLNPENLSPVEDIIDNPDIDPIISGGNKSLNATSNVKS